MLHASRHRCTWAHSLLPRNIPIRLIRIRPQNPTTDSQVSGNSGACCLRSCRRFVVGENPERVPQRAAGRVAGSSARGPPRKVLGKRSVRSIRLWPAGADNCGPGPDCRAWHIRATVNTMKRTPAEARRKQEHKPAQRDLVETQLREAPLPIYEAALHLAYAGASPRPRSQFYMYGGWTPKKVDKYSGVGTGLPNLSWAGLQGRGRRIQF
jgi:hypothetical protein